MDKFLNFGTVCLITHPLRDVVSSPCLTVCETETKGTKGGGD